MRCEYCTRKLGRNELAHGIRYGIEDQTTGLFMPAKDSAYTIICNKCGETLLKLVYQKLNPANKVPLQHYPLGF
jgi:hypothetical protein